MSKAFDRLMNWTRKYYYYKLSCSRYIQPGDGNYIELNAGGRTITISEDEFDTPNFTIEDLINEAMDRWHADESLKNFNVLFEATHNTLENTIAWRDRTWMAKIVAKSEAEAGKIVIENNPESRIIQIWEMTKNWTHYFHQALCPLS